MKTWDAERVNKLVERLRERARLRLAARVYQSWMDRQVDAGMPPWVPRWLRLGRLLRAAGQPAQAVQAIRHAVAASSNSAGLLVMSLRNLAECLDEAGAAKSAAQTRELRDRVAKAYDEHPDTLKALTPAHVLLPATSRCFSMLDLEWKFAGDKLSTTEEDGMTILREQVRLSNASDAWAQFEARAPAGRDCRYPHVGISVRFPWRFSGVNDHKPVLELVNEMNLNNSAVSVCLDLDTGQIAARCRVAFTGCNEGTAIERPVLAGAQVEVTINLMLELLNMLSGWQGRVAELAHRLGDEQASSAPWLRP